jgi:hypothetical protein
MLANQMFPAALGIFMVVLIQDLKFPAWMYAFFFSQEYLMLFGFNYGVHNR